MQCGDSKNDKFGPRLWKNPARQKTVKFRAKYRSGWEKQIKVGLAAMKIAQTWDLLGQIWSWLPLIQKHGNKEKFLEKLSMTKNQDLKEILETNDVCTSHS